MKGKERECRKIIEKKKLLDFITNQQKSFLTSTGFIPTSIMTAPGFIQLPLTIFGCPTAEIMISACLVISSGFLVLEWTILTVASSLYKQIEGKRLKRERERENWQLGVFVRRERKAKPRNYFLDIEIQHWGKRLLLGATKQLASQQYCFGQSRQPFFL